MTLNDSLGNAPFTITLEDDVENGTLVLQPNGQFTYSPDDGFSGTDRFRYRLTDADGDTDDVGVSIVVDEEEFDEGVDANRDNFATDLETPVSGNVTDNDDLGNGGINVTLDEAPGNGTVVLQPNGDFTYTPGNGFEGQDSFRYTLTDIDGDSDTTTVRIEVGRPQTDQPTANETQTGGDDDASFEVKEPREDDYADTYRLYDRDGDLLATLSKDDTSEEGRDNLTGLRELDWEGQEYGFDPRDVYFVTAQNDGERESELTEVFRRDVSPIAIDLDSSGAIELTGELQSFDFVSMGA